MTKEPGEEYEKSFSAQTAFRNSCSEFFLSKLFFLCALEIYHDSSATLANFVFQTFICQSSFARTILRCVFSINEITLAPDQA